MNGERCETCYFWQAVQTYFGDPSTEGFCRRFPPTVKQKAVYERNGRRFALSMRSDWCGEHRTFTIEQASPELAAVLA